MKGYITKEQLSDSLKQELIDIENKLVYSVMDFGAKGDGVTDDSYAINKAFKSIPSGSTLLFPDGKVFLLGSVVNEHHSILNIQNDIIIKGKGTLKVKDNIGDPFNSILRLPERFNRIEIYDITIDENATNNPLQNVDPGHNGDTRVSIYRYSEYDGGKCVIDNVTFNDCVGSWQVVISKVKYFDFINCTVNYSSYVPPFDYDRTTLYHTGKSGSIKNNTFNGNTFSLTCIELHGNGTICENNIIKNYANGIFICNDEEQNGMNNIVKNISVQNNNINVSSLAIQCWFGWSCDVKNVIIDNNNIYIDPSKNNLLDVNEVSTLGIGIRTEIGQDILIENISIKNNLINHKKGYLNKVKDLGVGIQIFHYDDNGKKNRAIIKGLTIKGNTVMNSYNHGLMFAFQKVVNANCSLIGIDISNNNIINPCLGITPDQLGGSLESTDKGCHIWFIIECGEIHSINLNDNNLIFSETPNKILSAIYVDIREGVNTNNINFRNNILKTNFTNVQNYKFINMSVNLSNSMSNIITKNVNDIVNESTEYINLGFRPSVIDIRSNIDDTNKICFGYVSDSFNRSIFSTSSNGFYSNSYPINIDIDGSSYIRGVITIDDYGFLINWLKSGESSGTLNVMYHAR